MAATKRAKAKPKVDAEQLTIQAPAGIPEGGRVPSAAYTKLTRRQGAALKALRCSLDEAAERCEMNGVPNGRVVQQDGHVIRYLLDRAADAMDELFGDGWEPERQ